jgi:hypothetical protein
MERASEAIHVFPSESPALKSPASACSVPGREYHVFFDGRHWNVTTGDGESGPSSFDRDVALTLAIRAAEHDHADGLDTAVCVEEQDGTFRLAWASA